MIDFLDTDILFSIRLYYFLIYVGIWLGICLILYLLNKARIFLTPQKLIAFIQKRFTKIKPGAEYMLTAMVFIAIYGIVILSAVQGILWVIHNWPK